MRGPASRADLTGIVRAFQAPVKFAFGYGSGVMSQGKRQLTKQTQVDLIFAVENPLNWHAINIQQNPGHYSFLKYFGPRGTSWVQQNLGAGVYFNPFVNVNGIQVKYGVASLDTLKDDLLNWRSLYLAGRLHKPVAIVASDEETAQAQSANLLSAMSVGLLLSPELFKPIELYQKIAGISYMGDVRMAVAENPQKVQNIVVNQLDSFEKLYRPLFSELGIENADNGLLKRSSENSFLLDKLPAHFRDKISGDILDPRSRRPKISSAIRRTVKGPSFTQSFKGLLTAGFTRSASYALQKLTKRWL